MSFERTGPELDPLLPQLGEVCSTMDYCLELHRESVVVAGRYGEEPMIYSYDSGTDMMLPETDDEYAQTRITGASIVFGDLQVRAWQAMHPDHNGETPLDDLPKYELGRTTMLQQPSAEGAVVLLKVELLGVEGMGDIVTRAVISTEDGVVTEFEVGTINGVVESTYHNVKALDNSPLLQLLSIPGIDQEKTRKLGVLGMGQDISTEQTDRIMLELRAQYVGTDLEEEVTNALANMMSYLDTVATVDDLTVDVYVPGSEEVDDALGRILDIITRLEITAKLARVMFNEVGSFESRLFEDVENTKFMGILAGAIMGDESPGFALRALRRLTLFTFPTPHRTTYTFGKENAVRDETDEYRTAAKRVWGLVLKTAFDEIVTNDNGAIIVPGVNKKVNERLLHVFNYLVREGSPPIIT